MSESDHAPVPDPREAVTGPGDGGFAGALPAAVREVEQFVATAGWDQAPQLFALVPTGALLAGQPQLAGQVDDVAPLTPVAQEALPEGELDVALAGIEWPDAVAGCVLAHEIVVLPPSAEHRALPDDAEGARQAAAAHPDRREGRLVAAVLRDGAGACVLRLRGTSGGGTAGEEQPDELVEDPALAPNLLRALLATLS
ncbi:MAG: PPA1309 family protein [Pseudonocardiaceae bacterium]